MAKKVKIKDTDYLFLSAYIHAKEPKLIDGDRIDRMLEAKSPEDALKVIEESGWSVSSVTDMSRMEVMLSKRREDVFKEMSSMSPNPAIVDLFRIKYDYHNAKVLIKAKGMGISSEELLLGSGRYPAKKLIEAVLEGKFAGISKTFSDAYLDADNTLARTGDPQISDFILDRAFFTEYLTLADGQGSKFLSAYVRLSIDISNLRSVVRSVRMKKDTGFLKQALVSGGDIKSADILNAYESIETVVALFKKTELRKIMDTAEDAIKGGRLTEFEKLCDEMLLSYLSEAKFAGFNEKPLIRYLCAVEAEINSIRIVMTGQFAGLPAEKIKERLREGL